jgi:prephenate dehydrogenase
VKQHFKRISIIGVGLLGGSIGMDIKKKGISYEVVGIVRRQEQIAECIKAGAIDKGSIDNIEGTKDADMIIFATPVSAMPKIAKEIKCNIKPDTIVIDVASVKGKLVRQMEDILGTNYVGTHPMAGSEKKGVSAAKTGLFYKSKCIITPTEKTSQKFLKEVKEFWALLRANTVILSPQEHDKIIALVSHLPHLMASSLVNIMASDPIAPSCIGPGFKDSTRIAASPPLLWQEICEWNREEILTVIDKFQNELSLFKSLIDKKDWVGVFNKLQKAKELRDNL